jgi:hypothetical protein
MAMNFTIILFQRQHFGDEPDHFDFLGPNVPPFVGSTKDFSFNCPNVNPRETAVLMFQSLGVVAPTNVLQINGIDVFGGLPVADLEPHAHIGQEERVQLLKAQTWSGNIMLVEPRHKLKAADNIMHIESRGNDFIIDNVVIVYKTVDRQTPPIVG